MKSAIYLLILTLLSSSCERANQILNRNPHLELSKYPPYDLEVSDFRWGYGMTEINTLDGDFELLDQRVYDLLKDKSGLCKLYFKTNQPDQYGEDVLTNKYIGVIDIDELNKYHDWKYWHQGSGIGALVYKNIVNAKNSTKVDSVDYNKAYSTEHLDAKLLQNNIPKAVPEVFGFAEDDLYPLQDERESIDSTRYVLDGIIDQVDLETGIVHLIAGGNFYTVIFNPTSPSEKVKNRLSRALKKGNIFESICAPKNENTLQIVTVQITEK